jgi:hypothetical protein
MLEARLGRPDFRVVGMGLDVFLQILGPLEGLATEVALVRLQRDMHTNVGGDVVTLDGGGVAVAPLASQVQVVGALAADMALADVFLLIASLWSVLRALSTDRGELDHLRRALRQRDTSRCNPPTGRGVALRRR